MSDFSDDGWGPMPSRPKANPPPPAQAPMPSQPPMKASSQPPMPAADRQPTKTEPFNGNGNGGQRFGSEGGNANHFGNAVPSEPPRDISTAVRRFGEANGVDPLTQFRQASNTCAPSSFGGGPIVKPSFGSVSTPVNNNSAYVVPQASGTGSFVNGVHPPSTPASTGLAPGVSPSNGFGGAAKFGSSETHLSGFGSAPHSVVPEVKKGPEAPAGAGSYAHLGGNKLGAAGSIESGPYVKAHLGGAIGSVDSYGHVQPQGPNMPMQAPAAYESDSNTSIKLPSPKTTSLPSGDGNTTSTVSKQSAESVSTGVRSNQLSGSAMAEKSINRAYASMGPSMAALGVDVGALQKKADDMNISVENREPSSPTPSNSVRPYRVHPGSDRSTFDYAQLHAVVGHEIDRMEIRLSATIQRMIDQRFLELRDQMEEIEGSQKKLSKKLDLLLNHK